MSIEEAKDRLSIPTLAAQLFPDWKPAKCCKRPWGEDNHASFSVFDNGRRWKDHATGEHGDAVDFLARALGLSPEDGIRRFIEMAGGGHREQPAPLQQAPSANAVAAGGDSEDKKAKRAAWPVLEILSPEEEQTVSTLRHLPPVGAQWAARDAVLRGATVDGSPSWLILSACKRNAQARRLDGKPFEMGGESLKAKTLPGSIAQIPVGCFFDVRWPLVAVVEGGPDVVAAYAAIQTLGLLDTVAVCGMLGAAMKIPPGALATFRNRRARIIQHADAAGERAADAWARQIHDAGGKVDIWTPDKAGADLNDIFHLPAEETAAAIGEAFDYAKGGN